MPQYNASNYLEAIFLNHIFRGNTWSKPTNIAIALCTGVISENLTGETLPECANAGAYARQSLAPSNANWGAGGAGVLFQDGSSSGVLGNNSAITFPTASAAWAGTITHVAIVDSGEYGAGNMFFYGQLSASKVVGINDTFSFAISGLQIRAD